MDLGGLIGRMMPDAVALAERVLQQAQAQLAQDDSLDAAANRSPDELITAALGNRLARLIAGERGLAASEPSTAGLEDAAPSPDEELTDMNGDLAAALGACDCWGRQLDCPICEGGGSPGWALPDRQLFARYVHPAVRVLTSVRASPADPEPGTGNSRKDHADVEHVTR